MGQLEDMQLFIRIVDAGGIGRAAEQLDIAKSAVSRRLVELEKHLGVRLLNRTTRTSSLTEAGRIYYKRALGIVDDVTELNSITADDNTSLQGTIKLAAPLSFGLCHLAGAIDDFLKQHANIRIHIDFSDRQVDLVEEGLDLAFRIAELKDSSLIARRICPIRFRLCASPAYLEKHGTPELPADLKKHRLLHYNMSASGYWRLYDASGKESVIHVSGEITANNGDFLKRMVMAGHGIVQLPTFICWQELASGGLVAVLPDYSLLQRHACAVYPLNRYLSQRVRILIEFLVERFGDEPYWDRNINP